MDNGEIEGRVLLGLTQQNGQKVAILGPGPGPARAPSDPGPAGHGLGTQKMAIFRVPRPKGSDPTGKRSGLDFWAPYGRKSP